LATQKEIMDRIEKLIPSDLMEKYNDLSFIEMANVPELKKWKDELEQAETDWWYADDI
jgi:hypothetical protein